MKKRILAMALILVMMFALMPTGTQYRERYTSSIICAEGGAFDVFVHSYVEYKQGGAWKTCKGASKNTDGMAMCKEFSRYLWSCADPGCPVAIM